MNATYFSFATSPFGRIFVAGTTTHITALYFIQHITEQEALAQAAKQLKTNTLIRNDKALAHLTQQIFTPTPPPLAPQGTPFQMKVWQALLLIPQGSSATYTDIAQHIGKPQSVRAVANAVGRNPISYLIPCHRVIRKDGSLGGFRWGISIKKEILKQENIFF